MDETPDAKTRKNKRKQYSAICYSQWDRKKSEEQLDFNIVNNISEQSNDVNT